MEKKGAAFGPPPAYMGHWIFDWRAVAKGSYTAGCRMDDGFKMAVLILSLTGACLGLAVLGRGGFAAFFSEPALAAIAAITTVAAVVGIFSGGNISPGVREDRSNRWVLPVFTIMAILVSYLPAYTDRAGIWTIDGSAVRWLGVAVYSAGGVLRVWPVFVLGRRFSGLVAIQPGHTLATTGIYGVIRNPSYLGLLVSSVGWALAFRSIAGLLLAALLVPPHVARIHAEEKLLQAEFGDEYDAYRARTWRMIPWIY